jgi:lipoate---protein ligase
MQRLLLTLDTPAANIALDEALLDFAEATGPEAEYLRVWESPQPIVVVGRSSRVHEEVDEAACRERGIPILRRSSGGAAIVAGPGCLMYAVVLSYARRPDLRDLTLAHAYALDQLAGSLRQHVAAIDRQGTSDLVIVENQPAGGTTVCKISGNSLRAKRTHFLYHGTLLYALNAALISALLKSPPRQPAYRRARAHADFVANLPLSRAVVREAVCEAWPTDGETAAWPSDRVEQLVRERYSRDEWNLAYGRSPSSF